MELFFLGTGAGAPAKHRNVSAIGLILTDDQHETWLFDCGEATQHQILSSSIRLTKVTRIFISHLHGDHIFGLPGVLSSRSIQGATEPLHLYGPVGLKSFVHASLQVSQTYLNYDLHIHEILDEQTIHVAHFTITVRELAHGISSYGYRIEEAEKPGHLQVDKLKQLGIPAGPIYRELKAGKTIQWNGKLINGNDFLSPPIPGRLLAICGDTKPTESTIALAQDVDVLVHEATFSKEQKDRARKYNHSTTEQAAEIAKKAHAKTLILTHLSSRFHLEDHPQLLTEATAVFPHTYIAADGWSYPINRSS